MINLRRSKSFKMISVHERGFYDLPGHVQQKYKLDRDFSSLPIDDIKPAPTIIECMPLLARWDHLTDSMSFGTHEARQIFRQHVIKVSNLDSDVRLDWETQASGPSILKADSVNLFPRDFLTEVVGVIISHANESTRPFTPPDTSTDAARSRVLESLVEVANIETAKATPSKSKKGSRK